MKIRIDIDLQPSKTEELDRLARLIKSLEAIINALESEIENYRRRLERIEEMTTRFESNHEEN
jgi:molecular chaperone GrpE (heat shock protein)